MRRLYDAGFEAGRIEGVKAAENAQHGDDDLAVSAGRAFIKWQDIAKYE